MLDRSKGALCHVPDELDLGGGPRPRDGALHPEHCVRASLLEKRDADKRGYVSCPQPLAPRLANTRVVLDILNDDRPPGEKFLNQGMAELRKRETLCGWRRIATPRAPDHNLPATDFSVAAAVHAKMLAHHPARGCLDREGLGKCAQRIAEP